MTGSRTLSIAVWAVALFAGSFVATVALRAAAPPEHRPDPLAEALGLSPEESRQIRGRDPSFHEEMRALRHELGAAREDFARLLEDPTTEEEVLRRQIDQVIEAHNRLERRVFEHILTLSEGLDTQQRRALLALCAEGVRKGPKAPWRHRRGWEEGGRGGRHGPGDGPPGPGRGRGGPGWGQHRLPPGSSPDDR